MILHRSIFSTPTWTNVNSQHQKNEDRMNCGDDPSVEEAWLIVEAPNDLVKRYMLIIMSHVRIVKTFDEF